MQSYEVLFGMKEFLVSDVLEIYNGRDYSHLQTGKFPLYGSGGLMSYVNSYLYNGEAILLPRKGTLNNIMYVNEKFWTVDTMYYATVNPSFSTYYIFAYLSQLNLKHLDSGSTLPSMTKTAYNNIKIVLPSLNTQKSIAHILSTLDQKIAINNQINAQLEQMAKTLYDYWFVQFDFPDENGKPYKSSGGEMVYNDTLKREIPKGWEVKSLGEIANVKKGTLITEKTANTNGSIKVISAGLDFSYYHDIANYPENTITISASGANAGFINFWREPIFACDCTVVTTDSIGKTLYILNYLKNIQEFIYQQARGSAQPHVYPKDIEILNIVLPPINFLKKFNDILEKSNLKSANNQKQNQQLTQLRDFLLPMLMNGQVGVGDD